MVAIICMLGAIQIFIGIAVGINSVSAIHEILGAILFGMGVLAVGLGFIAARIDCQLKLLKELSADTRQRGKIQGELD